MSFWQRDEVYPERFRIAGGRSRIDPGAWGLLEWNFGTRERPSAIPLALYDMNGAYVPRGPK